MKGGKRKLSRAINFKGGRKLKIWTKHQLIKVMKVQNLMLSLQYFLPRGGADVDFSEDN